MLKASCQTILNKALIEQVLLLLNSSFLLDFKIPFINEKSLKFSLSLLHQWLCYYIAVVAFWTEIQVFQSCFLGALIKTPKDRITLSLH